MNLRKILLTISLVALCMDASAFREHVFRHFKIDEGLPDNSITAAAHDRYGFLWFGSKTGIFRYDGQRFLPLEEYNQIDRLGGWVFDLYEDRDGMMWFASHSGVGYYNPMTGKITLTGMTAAVDTHIEQDGHGAIWLTRSDLIYRYHKDSGRIDSFPAEDSFSCVSSCADSHGIMWFAGNDGQLRRFDETIDRFIEIAIPLENGELPHRVQTVSGGQLLIGTTHNRIIRMDVLSGAMEQMAVRFIHPDGASLQRILERVPGEYWIATRRGLYIYKDRDKSTEFIGNNDQWELEDLNVICMSKDREGNVWIGTFHSGLSVWYNSDDSLKRYFPDGNPGSIRGSLFHAMAEDREGNIWIGTQDGILNKLSAKDRLIQEVSNPDLGWQNYYSILATGDDLWLGTYGNGIYVMDSRTGRISRKMLPGQRIVCMTQGPDSKIYVGTAEGMYIYEDGIFKEDTRIGSTMVHAICFDSNGAMWVGSYRDGLYILYPGADSYRHIQANPDREDCLNSDYVTYLYEDLDHRMWVTTEGDCIASTQIDDGSLAFRRYGRKDGFPTNTAGSVIQDSRGYLWIGTTGGLVKFDPRSNRVIDIYCDPTETTGNFYIYDSVLKSSRGSVYMGTPKGIIAFYPEQLKPLNRELPVYIIDASTKDRDQTVSLYPDGTSPFATNRIKVPRKKSKYLEISYSALSFSPNTPIEYEYCLSHKGKMTWTRTGSSSIVFSDLRQGHHHFKVRMAGSSDSAYEQTLNIRVAPPFWSCNAAVLLYILMAISGCWYAFHMRMRRLELKRKAEMDELQNAKDKELYDAKIDFFTNITHEIRTPLSLIKMPLDKILKNKEYTSEAQEDIMTMERNMNRLIEITDQLLDMRKMEANSPELNFIPCDARTIVQECAAQFVGAAKEKGRHISVSMPDQPLKAMVDIDAVKKILYNLISNAIKYGRSNIWISAEEVNARLRIQVDSDGELIAGDTREMIFEPFFRIDENKHPDTGGTGLGLPYSRTLATLMNGTLRMDPDRRDVNSFVLELPFVQDIISQSAGGKIEEDRTKTEGKIQESHSRKHTILLVEDSIEMMQYLERELSSLYKVICAGNGAEALRIMAEKKVDMVVSDIMMPVMDGCELCNRIKTNVDYSHIPVILLTAAVGVKQRIDSLKIGADGYIEKPFSIDLLMANIYNLFKNREISYHQFTASPLTHFSSSVSNEIDDDFMERLHDAIMQNMADKELNIDDLKELMKISKATLYRKIKANTGLNTSEYVRLCRLKKAAELLASKEYRINEVAYMVGFTSPSYFATAFQKQFNISPSAFVKNLDAENNK